MRRHGPVWSLLTWLVTWLIAGSWSLGAEPAGPSPDSAALRTFFEERVRPVLVENCQGCHGPDTQKGGLRLDSLGAMLAGGDSGPAVVPGNRDESLLVEAIHPDGFVSMPPRGRLGEQQLADLTRWVETGAYWPGAEATATPPKPVGEAAKITDTDRAFWSFQPLKAVDPPAAGDGWARNDIDRFIFQRLAAEGLTPSPEADRATLIRRLTFDLTGLPPEPEEVSAFVSDTSPGAYEALVDRLLDSPAYSERWGRHWLDLVRYAESDGHRQDAYRPGAWRYRDYVIRSFNDDKPYDLFVLEQLAGDELFPDDPEMRVATSYYRHGPYEYNQRDAPRQWADIVDEITDVTGEVFLGLSVGCARCHDHKFDPFLQSDYYRLQAFFTPISWRDDLPLATAEQAADYHVERAAWELRTAEIRAEMDEIERPHRERAAERAIAMFPEDMQALLRGSRTGLPPGQMQLYDLAFRQVTDAWKGAPGAIKGEDKERYDALKAELTAFDWLKPTAPELVQTATDIGPEAPPTVIPGRRNAEPVDPGTPAVLDPELAAIPEIPPTPGTTGRRLALAAWLTRPDNPLSTRVIANRIWQYHFGRGIVATSSDFGRLGDPPSHPELLDWLAARFVADGWSFKEMHRLLVLSATYRQASAVSASESVRIKDPENRLLWRMNPRRLDAEEIRDSMLAVSGELETTPKGGPSVEATTPRRAIYTKVLRNKRDELLDAFDAPDNFLSTATRNRTVTPSQALLLINSDWSLARARAFAARLKSAEPDDPSARLALAFRLAFAREPIPSELAEAANFLAAQRQRIETQADGLDDAQSKALRVRADDEALTDLCHALLNANEFLHLD